MHEFVEFRYWDYYVVGRDPLILEDDKNLYMSLSRLGLELALEYYSEKYETQISLAEAPNDSELITAITHLRYYLHHDLEQKDLNVRRAFLLGADTSHATPLIYIKEGDEEILLFADSTGLNLPAVLTLWEKFKIPVYTVELPRQKDGYSCYTDALIFCRDTTAFDKETNLYRIPSLLKALKSRAQRFTPGYFLTLLPNELLKTAQSYHFLKAHEESSKKIVHKKETLEDFRKRYTEKNRPFTVTAAKYEENPSYLRKKSIRLANTLEIFFFLRQLRKRSSHPLSKEEVRLFITAAKKELAFQGHPSSLREGLFKFTRMYLSHLPVRESLKLDAGSFPKLTTSHNKLVNYLGTPHKLKETQLASDLERLKRALTDKPEEVTVIFKDLCKTACKERYRFMGKNQFCIHTHAAKELIRALAVKDEGHAKLRAHLGINLPSHMNTEEIEQAVREKILSIIPTEPKSAPTTVKARIGGLFR